MVARLDGGGVGAAQARGHIGGGRAAEEKVRDIVTIEHGGNKGLKEHYPAAAAQSSNTSEAVLMFLLIQLTKGPLSITCARMARVTTASIDLTRRAHRRRKEGAAQGGDQVHRDAAAARALAENRHA